MLLDCAPRLRVTSAAWLHLQDGRRATGWQVQRKHPESAHSVEGHREPSCTIGLDVQSDIAKLIPVEVPCDERQCRDRRGWTAAPIRVARVGNSPPIERLVERFAQVFGELR
jgi:hypothetical protein